MNWWKSATTRNRIVILGLLVWSYGVQAQEFLNLSFEHNTPRGYPLVWQVNEGSGLPSSIRIDSSQAYNGQKCLRITARQASMLLAGLFFSVEQLKGRTLTLTGQIRTDSLQGGVAQLFHYDYGQLSFSVSKQMASQTTAWQTFRYSFSMPAEARGEGFVTGIKVNGTGNVYLDAVRIELDGKELIDINPDLKPLTLKQQTWLNQAVLPLRLLKTL